MKQLDPKAVWLFFISSVFRFLLFTWVLSWMVGWVIIAFNVVGALRHFQPGTEPTSPFGSSLLTIMTGSIVADIVLWIVISLVLAYIWARLSYHYYRYELREDGFRKEHGVIWKKYVSIPYDRIQNVDIFRGIIARLLGLSDLQIQTAGGITAGSYGAFAEGRLPGLAKEEAERMRDELITRARQSKSQGL